MKSNLQNEIFRVRTKFCIIAWYQKAKICFHTQIHAVVIAKHKFGSTHNSGVGRDIDNMEWTVSTEYTISTPTAV